MSQGFNCIYQILSSCHCQKYLLVVFSFKNLCFHGLCFVTTSFNSSLLFISLTIGRISARSINLQRTRVPGTRFSFYYFYYFPPTVDRQQMLRKQGRVNPRCGSFLSGATTSGLSTARGSAPACNAEDFLGSNSGTIQPTSHYLGLQQSTFSSHCSYQCQFYLLLTKPFYLYRLVFSTS